MNECENGISVKAVMFKFLSGRGLSLFDTCFLFCFWLKIMCVYIMCLYTLIKPSLGEKAVREKHNHKSHNTQDTKACIIKILLIQIG